MARIYAEFQCVGQGMERADENILAEGARGAVGARFALCSKWDGLSVYAHFQHMAAAYDVPLEEGAADVPSDVMKSPGFFVSVFGETGEGERLTSERVFVELRPSLDAPGVPAPPMDRTLLQVLEAKVQTCIDAAAALRADADAGAFDGDPFSVSHVFGSVAEMEAYEGAEVGAFAVINSGADQEDNARVYQRQADGWLFLVDMSGTPGKDGEDGEVSELTIPIAVQYGGTGAEGAEAARANLGAAAADHDHDGVYSKADHDHDGVYSDANHTHTLSSLGAAAASHKHGYSDLSGVAASSHSHGYADIEGVAASMLANQGNGPFITLIPEYNADATVSPSDYNKMYYLPASGVIEVEMIFTTTAAVAANTPLFYLPFTPYGGTGYASAGLATVYATNATATNAQSHSTNVSVKVFNGMPDGFGCGVSLTTQVGASRRIVLKGYLPTQALIMRHDPSFLEAKRDAVCAVMRSCEGQLTYDYNSLTNAQRYDPFGNTPPATDCSGLTYYCYAKALGWNIGGVEDTQVMHGRFIGRFAKGEEIPTWLLQKADLLCLYRDDTDLWTHAAMYMGNNELWDLSSSAYPNGVQGVGPYLRSDNVATGLTNAWTSHAWTHIDVVRFIV